jgi:alanine-glyoxylate transaminase/serine-glyoxylate transaminase/serine-pyruvate transaminase
MGPGPSDVHPRVLAALSRPTIGHLDPAFIGMMEETKELLQYALRTDNPLTLPVSAPGSAGMEACFVNLVEPGEEVIVCVNGVFGGRMRENVLRAGGVPVMVEDAWGMPVDPQRLEDALRTHPNARLVAFVQAETSTGVLSDVRLLTEIAHNHDALVIVDAVTSVGGCALEVDAWDVDAIYSGTQKCLSAPPGISPVSFGPRAVERLRARRVPVQSWFLDNTLVMGYWGDGARRSYHHTAPVNALYGLHEALLLLWEEGLEKSWERHARMHRGLRAGLEALGIEFFVAPEYRLPQLNALRIPEQVNDAEVRGRLLSEHGLEIGAGLGELAGKVWRIGLMGYSARSENVFTCLAALEQVLGELGAMVEPGAAVAAAANVLDVTPLAHSA